MRVLEPIQRWSTAATLRREHFLAQHTHPFLVHALGTLTKLDPSKVDDLTTDRLVVERPRQMLGDAMMVVELAPRDIDQNRITIGVTPGCDVVLDDASVSKRHAWFDSVGETWRIWDDDSSAGTQVNGEGLAARTPRVLTSGDTIALGYVEVMFFTTESFYELIRGLYSTAAGAVIAD